MIRENRNDIVYAIEVEGEACGGIGLHRMRDVYRFNAEIGYWLSEQHWGKGIVTEAVKLMVDYGFSNQSFTRIYAGIFSNNKASMRVLEKCEFRQEAVFTKSVKKDEKFLNEHIFSVLKEDWQKNMK
jgi:RimJ/RimL family protein N-acetyltransferase